MNYADRLLQPRRGDEVLKTDTAYSDSSDSFSSGSTRRDETLQGHQSINTPVDENRTNNYVQFSRSQYPSFGSYECGESWATTPSGTGCKVTKVSAILPPPSVWRRGEFNTSPSDTEGGRENVNAAFTCLVHSTSSQSFPCGLATPEDYATYIRGKRQKLVQSGSPHNVINSSPTTTPALTIGAGPYQADWETIIQTTPSPPMDNAEPYPYNCGVSPLFGGNGWLKPHDHEVQTAAGTVLSCGPCCPKVPSPRLAVSHISRRSHSTPEHQLPTGFYLPELDPEDVEDVLDGQAALKYVVNTT